MKAKDAVKKLDAYLLGEDHYGRRCNGCEDCTECAWKKVRRNLQVQAWAIRGLMVGVFIMGTCVVIMVAYTSCQ